MPTDNKPTQFIKSHLEEATKQYITYDGLNRMEYVYVAIVEAKQGDQCLVTQYGYDGATTRINKSKEFLGTWDSSWDL